MAPNRILGILLLVVGCILFGLAYSASQSVADQTKHLFTGNFRDRTTYLLLGGAVSAVAGIIALLVPTRRVGWGGGHSS